MNDEYVLSRLKMKEDERVEGAIFLTYSINCKEVIAALLKMFTADDEENNDKEGNNGKREWLREFVKKWQNLLCNGMNKDDKDKDGNKSSDIEKYQELCENVAFVCNDGNDSSVNSPIYIYTAPMMYYYKKENMSFHPKLFVLKYTKEVEENKRNTYFRIMIGSMNFVNSRNKEFMIAEDVQAYSEGEIPDEGDRCDEEESLKYYLERLLDYDCITSGNGRNSLKKVVDNLFDGLYFKKDTLPEILVFPDKGDDFKKKLKEGGQKIMSPFLTESLLKEYGNCEIYTMEDELEKNGFEPASDDDKDAYTFWVYSTEQENNNKDNETEKKFNHIKMYVLKDEIYAGSANFTENAFNKNKEILVKMKLDDEKRKELENEVFLQEKGKKGYFFEKVKYKLNTDKMHKEKDKLKNDLRNFAVRISNRMVQEMKLGSDNHNHCLSCEWENEEGKNKTEQELEAFSREKEIKKLEVSIAPAFDKENRKSIKESVFSWDIGNRIEYNNNFIFSFNGKYKDKKTDKISDKFKLTIKPKETTDNGNDNINSTIELAILQGILDRRSIARDMLEGDIKEKGLDKKGVFNISGCIQNLPSLEGMLDTYLATGKWLENKEIFFSSVSSIKCLMSEVKSNSGTLTENEKKQLGIDKYNVKLLDRILEQWENLKREFEK